MYCLINVCTVDSSQFWTTKLTFHCLFRFRRQLQRRLQSLPPARLRSASQNEPGSRRVSAGERVCTAVHVRYRHPNLPELLRSELQDFPSDPAETPGPQIQLQPVRRHQQWRSGSQPSAARPTGCQRSHVETLVDYMDIYLMHVMYFVMLFMLFVFQWK